MEGNITQGKPNWPTQKGLLGSHCKGSPKKYPIYDPSEEKIKRFIEAS